jgi:hypothetical protein
LASASIGERIQLFLRRQRIAEIAIRRHGRLGLFIARPGEFDTQALGRGLAGGEFLRRPELALRRRGIAFGGRRAGPHQQGPGFDELAGANIDPGHLRARRPRHADHPARRHDLPDRPRPGRLGRGLGESRSRQAGQRQKGKDGKWAAQRRPQTEILTQIQG